MKPEIDRNVVIAGAQESSLSAATKALPNSGRLRLKIYEFLIGRGVLGATDYEMQRNLGIDGNSQRPSRGTLVTDGWVRNSGTTRLVKNTQCIVWIAADVDMLL
jgi:hypothetical protein